MKFKQVIITVIYSVIIATVMTMSNNIINPFKKKTPPVSRHPYIKTINPYTDARMQKKKMPEQEKDVSQPQEDVFEKLLELHQPLSEPGPFDWLAQHHEPGQPYSQYIESDPAVPDKQKRVIYIALLGEFSPEQKEIIEKTARFIDLYYQMPVKFTSPISLEAVPSRARRVHPQTRDRQILSTYVIENLLQPVVPDDAFCLIAFTAADLWPGQGWNFVFGQASMEERVGVWSIYRNGDPAASRDEYKLCLLRTLKTGTHEIGHMFSLYHCIYFNCNMNGSNHRKESDRRPLWLCPVCLKKLHWALDFDLVQRYEDLRDFARDNGLSESAKFFQRSLSILEKLPD